MTAENGVEGGVGKSEASDIHVGMDAGNTEVDGAIGDISGFRKGSLESFFRRKVEEAEGSFEQGRMLFEEEEDEPVTFEGIAMGASGIFPFGPAVGDKPAPTPPA